MNAVGGAKQKRVYARLAEGNHCGRRVGIRERHWARPRVEPPPDRSRSAWINHGAGKSRAQSIEILVCASRHRRSAGRSGPFVRPGRLNHLKIVDVDGGQIVERRSRKPVVRADGNRKEPAVVGDDRAVFLQRSQHRFLFKCPANRNDKARFQPQPLTHGGIIDRGRWDRGGVMVGRINVFATGPCHD